VLDPAELTGLPGVQELLMLIEIARFADVGDWDVIVVDCPPSADMLRIVTAPATLLGYLERVWPAAARVRAATGPDLRRAVLATAVDRIVAAVARVRDLLANHQRTAARLVTLPERVAVAESARVRSAAALLGLRLTEVVVNKVLPDLETEPAAPVAREHPAVRWYAERRAEQLEVVRELRRRMPDLPVRIAPHTGSEPVGLASLSAMSLSALSMSSGAAAGVPDPMLGEVTADQVGIPTVGLESGQGLGAVFAMRMRLPVADPATLRLGRVEDDLIVGADGVRRRLRLAPVLRRCTVEGAELDGDQLVVRFRPDPEAWPE
jgi:arsenite-transporting ATPase